MKIENLATGKIVFDVGREKMGNTNRSTMYVWPVRILSVDLDTRIVSATWNSNPPAPSVKFRVAPSQVTDTGVCAITLPPIQPRPTADAFDDTEGKAFCRCSRPAASLDDEHRI